MSNFIRIGDGNLWINTELIAAIRLSLPCKETLNEYVCNYYDVQNERPYRSHHSIRESAENEIKRVMGVTDL